MRQDRSSHWITDFNSPAAMLPWFDRDQRRVVVFQVRVVEYDPGTESVRSPNAYVHRAEVWDLAACPSRTDRFFTVNNDGRRACRADTRSRALLRGMERGQCVQLASSILFAALGPTRHIDSAVCKTLYLAGIYASKMVHCPQYVHFSLAISLQRIHTETKGRPRSTHECDRKS